MKNKKIYNSVSIRIENKELNQLRYLKSKLKLKTYNDVILFLLK